MPNFEFMRDPTTLRTTSEVLPMVALLITKLQITHKNLYYGKYRKE